MILIFSISILILCILVYVGITIKEGMTLQESSSVISTLNKYYANESKTTNVTNASNEKSSIDSIKDLNITDPSFISIMNNTDLDNSSILNSINTLITKTISQETDTYITPATFKSMVDKINTVSDDDELLIELNKLTQKDTRFTYNGVDSKTIVSNIKSEMRHILNPTINI